MFWPALTLAVPFLNTELCEDVVILTQLAPELIQFGLVKPGTLYQCTKEYLWIARGAQTMGRGQRQDFDIILCSTILTAMNTE